jgi:hypothetical protein
MSFRRSTKSAVFCRQVLRIGCCGSKAVAVQKEGAAKMANPIPHENVSEEARTLAHKAVQKSRNNGSGWRISLDTWAVTLALALTALVWAGWIKRIPW